MCTGNVYCDQISVEAVKVVAMYLGGVLPEFIEQAAHVFEPGVNWGELIAEQNLNSNHPQAAYRELLKNNTLWIYNGHACIETERD